jgi:cobalt-zinc-cadmium efflux system membrane fusion protein
MQSIIFKILSTVLLVVLLTNCEHSHTKSDPHAGHDHEAEKEAVTATDEVHMVQRQMDVMDIRLGQITQANLSTTIKTNGNLELPPQNKASVSSVLAGRVKSIRVIEGDRVSKGKTLAILENPDFIQVQQDYMDSKNQLLYLEKEYLRKKQLFQDSISSAKDFQRAESEYRGMQARFNSLKAHLRMMQIDVAAVERGEILTEIPVRSPINGYVRLVEVNIGSYIEPERELFEIVDNERIHIDLMIYEKDIQKIKKGQKVNFTLAGIPDRIFEGSIFAIGKAFNDDVKAITVHAKIDNKSGDLLPGMYVDARIVTDQYMADALPDEAIVSDGGLNYIFILKETEGHDHSDDPVVEENHEEHDEEDGHDHSMEEGTEDHEEDEHDHPAEDLHEGEFIFQKIEINTGESDIGFTEVVPVQEIPENAKVVIKGAYYLHAEMKKGEGGHHH